MSKATATEVYQLLAEMQIPYERVDHKAVFTVAEIDFVIDGSDVKNLLMKSKKTRNYYFVICPGKKRLDIKALAKAVGESQLSFASEVELFDLLGLERGSVTPLALPHDTEHQITLVIDETIDQTKKIGFHPNTNTATVVIAFSDFKRFLANIAIEPTYLVIPEKQPEA
ncbi:prolyl-tRNA synthetase associated domain-containing protein [Enterococcus sp. AZ196]|uniref:prolyl-tRNA synthetase associated domain-containing protein n=1 Tax=Enterococcus sp. AZ196 TaxID=2774659 RepID=UPI003D2BC6E6